MTDTPHLRPLPDVETARLRQDGDISRLLDIMRILRDPEAGCPWDVAQTSASIAKYTIEEAHEVVDTIERAAWDEFPSELGDLLLQVVFHAQMQSEARRFDFEAVVRAVCEKMLARHPHVFLPEEIRPKTAPDWESLKTDERGPARVLDGVAATLPALSRAAKLQARAAKVGFDWPNTTEVLAKIAEESAELVEAKDRLTQDEVHEEMGDLLFVMANLARHLKVDPEAALRAANQKFIRRFTRIEDWLAEDGRRPDQSDLAEMDALWDRAKAIDKAEAKARAAAKEA